MTGEKRKEIVAIMAYLIGVREENLYSHYNHEFLNKLKKNKEATILRYLCKLRCCLFYKFKATDTELKYNLRNIDKLDWFDREEIMQLEKWGIPIIKVNYTSQQYIEDFSDLISKHIEDCRTLFADWLNFDYIKDLFIIPKNGKQNVYKTEFNNFMSNMDFYPFQRYIHWRPCFCGNILTDDEKFLDILYQMHNEHFDDKSKVFDMSEESKGNIYDFVETSNKAIIVVDCENSDVYKLYGVLQNLNEDSLKKVEKIILYDDTHAPAVWELLSKYTKIPVEHTTVERVLERKSLVDMKMTAGVCEAHYKYGIDSFILCSSDSDFWALITSLPDARFMVMHEDSKCSTAIKNAMEEHQILHCSMDEFYSGNATGLKKKVLLEQLRCHLPQIIGVNGKELAKQIFEETKIYHTSKDVDDFYNKHIKTLKLKINESGTFCIEICEQ